MAGISPLIEILNFAACFDGKLGPHLLRLHKILKDDFSRRNTVK